MIQVPLFLPLDVTPHLQQLRTYVEARDFAGYDPYDALNSPIVRALAFGTAAGRIVWTQLLRRCPLNLRPILLTPRGHNPKALGLFLGGYSRLSGIAKDASAREFIGPLLAKLRGIRAQGYAGNSWGYNFDWQSRVAFVPAGTPTIVNCAFIGHALLDCWELTRRQEALDLAVPISDFILTDLHRRAEGETICFSYTPIDENYVHNANLLGASLLIRLAHVTGDSSLRDPALAALAYSMAHQHPDGSWFYGERGIQHWIDSFHTGFNLEALRWFIRLGEGDLYRDAYRRGVGYYVGRFFLEDGTPKYYSDRTYPVDIHAPAEAIFFLSGEGDPYAPLVERILGWTLANLRDPRGYFWFRKGRRLTNRIPYMRWGQAWLAAGSRR